MHPAKATKVVHDVLHRFQTRQGLDCPPLDDTTRPIHDLQKFDSPISLAATGMIGRKLGITIPPKTNIFGDENGLYTIRKTVGLLCKIAEKHKKGELVEA